jgi:hypothetical protein
MILGGRDICPVTAGPKGPIVKVWVWPFWNGHDGRGRLGGLGGIQLIMALRGVKLIRGLEERPGDASPVMHQALPAELRTDVGALARDVAASDLLGAGQLGRAPSEAGSVRWPVSVGFSWSLALAALVLAVALVVIAVAGSDVPFISLVLGPGVAALMGGLVAVRRPGQPIGTLLCAYGLAGAAGAAVFAYAHAAVVHFPGRLPYGVPVMWMTSWDYAPAITLQLLVLPLVFPDGRLVSRRWRPVLWAAVAFVPLWVAGNAFAPAPGRPPAPSQT